MASQRVFQAMSIPHNRQYPSVLHYHDRTKHHLDRYARSLGYMDWENQPNPFRFYEDSPRIALPLTVQERETPYSGLYRTARSGQSPLTLAALAGFLELSLGLSAWKRYGASEWSLRMNPSSGNLHPPECYLLLPPFDGHPACVAHYNPLLHCLEIRWVFPDADAKSLERVRGFGLILSSVYWREAWKYGERAFRYCNHDLGHALAALWVSANLNGWRLSLHPRIPDAQLDRLLGFHRIQWPPEEREHADCLCWVCEEEIEASSVAQWLATMVAPEYEQAPNRLSAHHVAWPIIRDVVQATGSPGFSTPAYSSPIHGSMSESKFSAEQIIRKRRSAQAYNQQTSRIPLQSLRQMLERTLPPALVPFDRLCPEPNVHLVLFVHGVDGLAPGLYILVRNQDHLAVLQDDLDARFAWKPAVDGLPLYLLETGDYRAQAQTISCHQSIAGNSAFSLGMLARFEPVVGPAPWLYPRLYWESGFIGQVLYLEAEAKGLRGTGIGCFFDDVMHELLGLKGRYWQDLYHFTVGTPIEDSRIQTLSAYQHLAALRSEE